MEPCRDLKKALRAVLRGFADVESARLLVVGNRTWRSDAFVMTVLLTGGRTAAIDRAWRDAYPAGPPVVFDAEERGVLARFGKDFVAPFYVRDEGHFPEPLATPDLLQLLARLPDRPSFEAFDEILRRQDPNAPEAARQELIKRYEKWSTHAKAKRALIAAIEDGTPFALLLRPFAIETLEATSPYQFLGDVFWLAVRPVGQDDIAAYARKARLKLFAIANTMVPVGLRTVLHLQVGEEWLQVVSALAARARIIFLICDTETPGIATELSLVRHLEREHATMIVMPTADEAKTEYLAHEMVGAAAPASFDAERFRRRMMTFGLAITTVEFKRNVLGGMARRRRTPKPQRVRRATRPPTGR
jgi:hypothetical protein